MRNDAIHGDRDSWVRQQKEIAEQNSLLDGPDCEERRQLVGVLNQIAFEGCPWLMNMMEIKGQIPKSS
jgi:hypothetical protein